MSPAGDRPDPGGAAWIFWDGGRQAPPGWTAGGPRSAAELVADGLPHATACASRVYVGPSLGEVPQWELVDVLLELRRVLRVGGVVRIAAFDVEAAVTAYAQGDVDFFWDDTWDGLAGRAASQVLGSGAARALLTDALLQELLSRAGFADGRAEPFRASRLDPALAAPDQFPQHCCHVEARNPTAWPAADAAAWPSGVHLAWGDPDCDSIEVLWSAPSASRGALRYRPVGEGHWASAPASSRPTVDGIHSPYVFRATCPNLTRGRQYEYQVTQRMGDEVRAAPPSTFRSLPSGTGSTVRFAFLSDTGISGRADGLSDGTRRVVRAVRDAAPHFVLGGGDYAYLSSDPRLVSGQQAVHAWLQEMEPVATLCPLMVQYGNHDVGLGERYRDWAVHLPQLRTELTGRSRSYSFDAGPCHISAFYAPTEDIAPDEVAWLWQDLAAARERGCRWLVVFQHQPLLAHGSCHPADGRVERALARVLEHHEVDLHLSGHDQSYERTHPLTWGGGGQAARVSRLVEPGRPGRVPQGAGVVLAKVSPSGKRSDRGGDFSALPLTRPSVVAVADDGAHHFAVVDVDDSRLELMTYALRGGDTPLELLDHLVVDGRTRRLAESG